MPITRKFIRVANFDELQPTRRPKRAPHWLKLHVRYLDLEDYRSLSATERGILADLMRLAATRDNRIPWSTSRFVSQSLGISPHIVGKACSTLLELGFIVEFAEDEETRKNNDLAFVTSPGRNTTVPVSNSGSGSTSDSSIVDHCDQQQDDGPFDDIPF